MKKMDQYLVAGTQKYEVAYVAKKLGVKASEVREAVRQVGNGRNAVVIYLIEQKGNPVIKKLVENAFK